MTSLRQRMTEDLQVRNLSPHTQKCYLEQVSRFARHFSKSPEVLGPEDIRAYQVYLTNEKQLAPGSILIAVAALRFLYKVTLHRDWNIEDVIPGPKQVPALRDRPEDIPLLVRHFVEQFARQMNRDIDTIPSETMNALTRYSWPGNIRELQNLVERAVILSPDNVLQVPLQDLKRRSSAAITSSSQTLEESERAHILAVLEKTKWKLSGPNGAAARLGLNRSTLQFRMKKLGIVRPA